MTYVSVDLRRQVAEDANHICGYCLSDEALTGVPLSIDHIIPVAMGGQTTREICGWPAVLATSSKVPKPTPQTRTLVRWSPCFILATKVGPNILAGVRTKLK